MCGFPAQGEEKKARGAFSAAIERVLNQDVVVIADGMNYIKGFRYQLFCLAKSLQTQHCVVTMLFFSSSCYVNAAEKVLSSSW